jgi:hypothetical protein
VSRKKFLPDGNGIRPEKESYSPQAQADYTGKPEIPLPGFMERNG